MCDRQMLDVVEFLHKNKGLFACTQKQEEAWANWMGVTQPHSGGLRQILNDQNIANPFRFRAAALLLVPDLQQCLLEPNLFYWPQSSGNYIYKAESELYRRSPEDLKSFFADLLRVSVSYWNQSGEDSSSVLRGYQNAFVLIIQATEGERAQLELLEAFLPYVFLSPGFSQTVHFEYRWTVKILASRACEKVKDAMISYFQKQLLGENQCEASAAYFTTARSVAENTEIEIEPRCRLITKMLQFVLEQEVVIGWYDSCAKQLRGLIPYRFLRRSEDFSRELGEIVAQILLTNEPSLADDRYTESLVSDLERLKINADLLGRVYDYREKTRQLVLAEEKVRKSRQDPLESAYEALKNE